MQTEVHSFEQDVINASHQVPIVVDFWAEWCHPCRQLGPILEKLVRQADGAWRLVKINVDQNQAIARALHVQSIPSVKMFIEGAVAAEFLGALPEKKVIEWLNQNLPVTGNQTFKSGKQALKNGDKKLAQKLLKKTVAEEPENNEARSLLATLVFENNPGEAAELVKNIPENDQTYDHAQSILTLVRLLDQKHDLAKNINGDPRTAKNWQLYLNGINALERKNYETALEAWIDVIMSDRNLDHDGARKACIAIFKLLGHEHEITQKYHRRFSMALY